MWTFATAVREASPEGVPPGPEGTGMLKATDSGWQRGVGV